MSLVKPEEQRMYLFLQGSITPQELRLLENDTKNDAALEQDLWMNELIVEAVCKRALKMEKMKLWDNEIRIQHLEEEIAALNMENQRLKELQGEKELLIKNKLLHQETEKNRIIDRFKNEVGSIQKEHERIIQLLEKVCERDNEIERNRLELMKSKQKEQEEISILNRRISILTKVVFFFFCAAFLAILAFIFLRN